MKIEIPGRLPGLEFSHTFGAVTRESGPFSLKQTKAIVKQAITNGENIF